MSPFWPEMPELVEFAPPSSPGSSDSSADRWGWEQPRELFRQSGGRPNRDCPWWQCRVPAVPGCRRVPLPSSRWSRSQRRWPSIARRGCPIWCTCAAQRPAASWPRWARPGTSRRLSRARWSASSGPRAFTAITGEVFPEGIQTAENLLSRGLIDAIVPWDELRDRWATILGLWADRVVAAPAAAEDPVHVGEGEGSRADRSPPPSSGSTSRSRGRPTASTPSSSWQLTCRTPWSSRARCGETSPRVRCVALGRLDGIPVVVAATTDRRSGEPLTVGGLQDDPSRDRAGPAVGPARGHPRRHPGRPALRRG